MSPQKEPQKAAKSATVRSKASDGLSAEERAAMKETLKERKASRNKEEAEQAALAAIAAMPEPDRSMAQRIHDIVTASAPELMAKTWYGMPAYANMEGKVICFFQAASKFNVRYAELGFQPDANLDDGEMWPVAFALRKLTAADERKIAALVKKAAS